MCSGNGGWEREGVTGGDGDGVGGRVLVSGAGGRGVGWGEADTGSVGAWLVGYRLSVVYTQIQRLLYKDVEVHVSMRDEKEGRSKQTTRQSNTTHPR